MPDFENSYALKIWCRAADRSALTRRAWNGVAYGALENITVAFDGCVDPGSADRGHLRARAVRAAAVAATPVGRNRSIAAADDRLRSR